MTCRCDLCCGVLLVDDCSIYVDEAGKHLISAGSYFVLNIFNRIVAVARYSLHETLSRQKEKKQKTIAKIIVNLLLLSIINL